MNDRYTMGEQLNYHTSSPAIPSAQLEAFAATKIDRSAARLLVLSTIAQLGPSSIRSVAEELHWETSTVSARMNELKKLGLIVEARDATGKQLRTEHLVRGVVTHGGCWQARPDWRDFTNVMKGDLL